MRREITLLCMLTIVAFSYAQESFSGFRTGAYNGIYGTLSNPANIAANPRKWDANLFSISLGVANDRESLGLGNMGKVANMEKLGEEILNGGGTISTALNAEILGPSLMLHINGKHSVAFISRARIMVSATDFDVNLLRSVLEKKDNANKLTYPIVINSTKNQKAVANGWTEYGLSWGGVVYQDENHTVKAGATLKYLRGFSNSYANINKINGEVKKDHPSGDLYLNTAGEISLVNSGANFIGSGNNFQASDITKSFGTGYGADLGLVYEYRDENAHNWCGNCSYTKSYKFKLGVSLMDLGSIKYTPIKDRGYHYVLDSSKKISLDELASKPFEVLDKYAHRGKRITESYSVSLPATLRLIGDYHISNNFFVALDSQISVVGNDEQNPFVTNSLTVTPRYETRTLGAYLPVGYNGLSGTNAGVAFRAGPVFLGSGSLLSSLASGKQIDFFFGIRFGK